MEHDLQLISNWLSANRMAMNTDKTCYMLFSLTNELPCIDVFLNGTRLKQVFEFNYLGLTIDWRLKWKNHVQKVKNKIAPVHSGLKCKKRDRFE